ncbi:MAG: non-hydrolyzing UDP-N-acetylglucosamine 2-epimerase [Pseudomonadota bacterium]
MHICLIAGTRPEVIKLGPVYHALRETDLFAPLDVRFMLTGQHRELARQAAHDMAIVPDAVFDFAPGTLGLGQVVAGLMNRIASHLDGAQADLIVIQGDTNSALAGAMAGFYAGIPVAHVEAGLRSGDPGNPFPEEMNRRLIAHMATLHFAPTPAAARHLLREGVNPDRVAVTGNTIVDAVRAVVGQGPHNTLARQRNRRQVLVTCHRRENWGDGIDQLCRALQSLVAARPDIDVLFPVHGNPHVANRVRDRLAAHPHIRTSPPLAYGAFLAALRRSGLAITDSGGVQEEAACFATPLVIMRDKTERHESLDLGHTRLCRAHAAAIFAAAQDLLNQPLVQAASNNPFGDGHAAGRIVKALRRWHTRKAPLLPAADSFAGAPS